MAITSFIPKVWSARLQESLHKALVFGALCNRNYEGDISQYGDTVHINNLADITVKPYDPARPIDDPEQLSGSDITLTIDHAAYYNFYINDVDAAQARGDLMDAAMRNAAFCLAEDTEAYILGVIRQGAGKTETGAFPTADTMYEKIVAIKTFLDKNNVPRADRKLIVPADVEGMLLTDNRFITGSAAANVRLAEGSVARAAGFDVYVSADLTDEIVAMTPDSVTFANQLTDIEAYRPEKGFCDGVKGLSLCGAKVIQPKCVYIYKKQA